MPDAPSTASYLLYSSNPDLPNGYVLTPGNGLLLNNSGTEVTIGLGPKFTSFAALESGGGGFFAYNPSNDTFNFRDITSLGGTILAQNTFPNLSLGIVPETTTQAVRNYNNGSYESGRWDLNFIAGDNISIVGADNPTLNCTDVTLTLTSDISDLESVSLSSSTGLIIGGTNPILTTGTMTVDLPRATGSQPLYLQLTGTNPQTIGWAPGSSSVTSVGIATGNNTLNILNSPVTTSGSIDLLITGWGSIAADTTIDMNNASLLSVQYGSFYTGAAPDLSYGYPILYASSANAGAELIFNMVNALDRNGTIVTDGGTYPVCIPATEILTYAQQYCTFAGAVNDNGIPCYEQIYVTPTDANQSFQFQYGGTGAPAWAPDTTQRTDTVTLGATSVTPTGGGTDIVIGDGSYFVEDPNITPRSIVMCTSLGTYNGTEPAKGPITVALNPTTDTGELPVGFVIYGDPTVDNGNKVTYSVMSYES